MTLLLNQQESDQVLIAQETCQNPEKRSGRRAVQRTLGRKIATRLLQDLGCSDPVIEKGSAGEPIWPNGFSGSISHCLAEENHSLATAIVGKDTQLAFGIDIEPCRSSERLKRLTRSIFLPEEIDLLKKADTTDGLTIGFSAKETLYKALYPACKEWFWFHDARIVEVKDNSLVLRLVKPSLEKHFHSNPQMEIQWERVELTTESIRTEFIRTWCSIDLTQMDLYKTSTASSSCPLKSASQLAGNPIPADPSTVATVVD